MLSVLLIRLGALGDVADALPALFELRRSCPSARITFLTKAPYAELAALWAHEVLTYPRELWGLPEFVSKLGRRKFDMVLDLQGNFRSALISVLPHSNATFGFCEGISREGASRFYSRVITPPPGCRSRLDRSLEMVSAVLDQPCSYAPLTFPVHDAYSQKARQYSKGGAPVGLVTGTSRKGRFKSWPDERWSRFIATADPSIRFLLILGPGDRVPGWVTGACQVARCADPLEMIEMLRICRAVVGADTGPMHLAHLLGRPTLSLFGPKDPAFYGPQYNRHRTIWHRQVCGPCRHWRCDHVSCMWAISATEVENTLSQLLEDR